MIWDKDRRLARGDPLRRLANASVCEPALHPTAGAEPLLFPVADEALDAADPVGLVTERRELPLVYVGNQYERDRVFDTYFAAPAAKVHHLVAGKWTDTSRWPHVIFVGRIPFLEVESLYRRALVTVLLLPERYARCGQMTQRLFESVLAGCLPLTPTSIRSAERFTPPLLHVGSGADVLSKIDYLTQISGTAEHVRLLERCLSALDHFRLSRQLRILDRIVERLVVAKAPA